MFAMAESTDETRNIIIKQSKRIEYPLVDKRLLQMIKEDLEKEPNVYEDKIGFVLFEGD